MVRSPQTHTEIYTQDEEETAELQYCVTVCYSYRTRDSHSVEIQATKPICLVLTVHKQFFLYPVYVQERKVHSEKLL